MTKNAKTPEDIVKARLRQRLPQWCLFREEIEGIGPFGQKVRMDFWCYPKPNLLALGFDERPFGIETKSEELEDQRKRSAIRLVYQAAIYQLSKFPTKNGTMTPNFMLIYPSVAVLLDIGERDGNPRQTFQDGVEYALVRTAALWRVGELIVRDASFEVRFNGARYFDTGRGRSPASPLAGETARASR